MAFPYRDHEWVDLPAAQRELTELALAIAGTERVEMLSSVTVPKRLKAHPNIRIHAVPESTYGDAWTRDTGPVFAIGSSSESDGESSPTLLPLVFEFNGWGGKYEMAGDEIVGSWIAAQVGAPSETFPFVLEGGALELDGAGTLLTTPCLALPSRRTHLSAAALSTAIATALGVQHTITIEGQLAEDHTDGHIDTLARFVRPGEVVCMRGVAGDPNGSVLLAIEEQLAGCVDALGRRFQVTTIPSPGLILGQGANLLPASYCNYYLANGQVIVPTYDSPFDDEAVAAIAALFPERRTYGLSARALIEGGGAFHCLTQQQPSLPEKPDTP